jgi:hypothetical protein
VNTDATSLRVKPVSVAIEFKISDLVGGFFTAGAAAFFLTAMNSFPLVVLVYCCFVIMVRRFEALFDYPYS